MASEYKKASAYLKAVDKDKGKKQRVKLKMARERGRNIAKKLIKKAVAEAPKGKGTVPASVKEARTKLKAQTTGNTVIKISRKREFNDGTTRTFRAEPATILRRQTQGEIYETDKLGLSFPSLHDEFKKTMSLLHGGDVGDSL